MKKITANNMTWINIQDPKEKNLEELKEKFNLHPFIIKQFLPPVHRPKIEEHPGQIFIVLHFPIYDVKTKQTNLIELDFIITEDALITSYNKSLPELETFFNDCDLQDYHKNQYFKSSGHLLFGILDWLIDSCLPMLDNIGKKIEDIEKQVFEGKEKEMLMEIAMAKKDIIDFRRAIKPQRSVLEILGKKSIRIFGEKVRPLSQEIIGSIIRVWNILENHRELITSIEQTNNSLLSHKLSDIMKFLTVVSFITFPLSVIVGFFGMNVFSKTPILQNPFTWIIILILMFSTTGIMVVYFKKKKWL